MSGLPSKVSDAVRRLNPQIFGTVADAQGIIAATIAKPAKRIRQSDKPRENKLEAEFHAYLERQYPLADIRAQEWRVRLANGAWFKVDLVALVDGQWTAWEVKGNRGKNIDRGKLALKVAATNWPQVDWWLAWKADGEWNCQRVLA